MAIQDIGGMNNDTLKRELETIRSENLRKFKQAGKVVYGLQHSYEEAKTII